MKNIGLGLLALVVLNVAGCASAGEGFTRPDVNFGTYRSVAVMEVTGGGLSEGARNDIADAFNIELGRKGYRPVERRQIESVLSEQELQSTDFTSPAGAARAGRVLNVQALVLVNISEFGQHIDMTAKMIDVEDASMVWIQSGSGTTGRTLATVGGAVAGMAGGAALGGSRSGRIAGGVAGGVLGGVAGHELTPQETTQAKKVVKKICETLPPAM